MIETISKFCIVCGDDTTFGKVCEGCEYDLQQLHNAQYSAQISDLKPFRDRKTREIGEYSQGEIVQMLLHLSLNEYTYSLTAAEFGVPIQYLKFWSTQTNIERPIGPLLERAIERLLTHIPSIDTASEWVEAVSTLILRWVTLQEQMLKRTEVIMGQVGAMDISQFTRIVDTAESLIKNVEYIDVNNSADADN